MIELAFTGRSGLGGVSMRGRDVADRLHVPFYDLRELPRGERIRTLVLVKYWPENVASVRLACERLVFDPLDVWTQTKPDAEPVAFWRWCQKQTGCDVMLATSPAVAETMQSAGVRTIIAPHAADPRIQPGWHDPRGHVLYGGGQRFLGDQEQAIAAACKRIGRRFVARFDRDCWQELKGAALSLCVRFGRERSPLNLVGKPLVKVANAARAGVPVLATSDPAITSLADVELTTGDWESDLLSAIDSPPPDYPHDLCSYAEQLRAALND